MSRCGNYSPSERPWASPEARTANLPESLLFESEPQVDGWRLIKNLDSNGLDQIINKTGWNFFYIAGAIETNVFGSDGKRTTRKAIKRVIFGLFARPFQISGVPMFRPCCRLRATQGNHIEIVQY
jgi:hypothetical protein